ncbi:MAG: hypothetical protein IJA57_09235 [Alistipes sp.]|nr:hypothetical protein [Alistipes sp.]
MNKIKEQRAKRKEQRAKSKEQRGKFKEERATDAAEREQRVLAHYAEPQGGNTTLVVG